MSDAGFSIIEQVFSDQASQAILADLSQPLSTRSRAGARHLMSRPAVAEVARDPRLLAIARDTLGPDAIPYRATLFEKSGVSNWLVIWHQDAALPLDARFELAEWGPWSVKAGTHYAHAPTWALEKILALHLHLDDSTAANGPLRVIPGSHQIGVLSDDEVFRIGRERPFVDCLVSRGGILAMRPLLIHSSQKAQSPAPRRVLHIEYAAALELAPDIRLAVA